MVAVQMQEDMRRVLSDEGKVLAGAKVPEIPEEDLRRLFDTMLLVRVLDERMLRLQRQGRLGFYMTCMGEEASHFAVYPLRPSDWVFPSYREQGSLLWRGHPLDAYINQLYGNCEDPIKGRQMPVHHSARERNWVSVSSPVGTQIPQAVGAAYAAKVSGSDDVMMTYFGEGTTSTANFHAGLNFAGVWKAPVVFVCRNNGWAISVPREKQTASKTFASKAVAYGMPGVRVDGNDILAVIQASREAIDRARAGEGPTLIEARTYRLGGHSSSDDPSVYRDPSEPNTWKTRDPLNRFRGYLQEIGLWTEKLESEAVEAHTEAIMKVQAVSDRNGPPEIDTLFDDVYAELPWHLREQRAWLHEQARTKSPHAH